AVGSPGTNGLNALPTEDPEPEPETPVALDEESLAPGQLRIRELSSLPLAGAEISAFDPASKRIFVTCNTGLQIVDLSNPLTPTLLETVSFTTPEIGLNSSDVTSVSVHGGVVAVAVPNAVKEN